MVTICQSRSGEVACRLDINHALVDAASMPTLARDVAAAYGGKLLAPAPQFREAVAHIVRVPAVERTRYWQKVLGGVEPCVFPTDKISGGESISTQGHGSLTVHAGGDMDIYDFCVGRGITRFTFFQVAWSLVLSHYTTAPEACFGYLASGRDLAIDGIDEIVGPLINMLIGRVNLDADLEATLSATSERSVENFAYQHTSLAEVQHSLGLGGRRLFNTAITVRDAYRRDARETGLRLREIGGDDPHEVRCK